MRHDGRIVLAALGATGEHVATTMEVQVPAMPDVPGPEECEDWIGRMQQMADVPRSGWAELADMRARRPAAQRPRDVGRLRDQPISRPGLAFMADFVPVSVARATGQMGAGISLDNSMRFGRLVDTEWVLYDYDPEFATGGYLNGGARVWSQDGTLLGYASQTAAGFVR